MAAAGSLDAGVVVARGCGPCAASATFLAAEHGVTLSGIAWNADLLHPGEGKEISTETLRWHLDAGGAALVRHLFAAPLTRPLLLLRQEIRPDRLGLCAARESSRRRNGIRGAYRDARRREQDWLRESEAEQAERQRRTSLRNPPGRLSLSRVLAAAAPAPRPGPMSAHISATVAVYIALGIDGADDLLSPSPACGGTLLQDRTVRLWLARHRHLDATRLITTLTEALTQAAARDRGLILPELHGTPMPAYPSPW